MGAKGCLPLGQAKHLPLVAAFLARMGLAAVAGAAALAEMAVDLGSVVKLMVLDTLSGRSPLYRLERFAAAVDTEPLLGKEVSPGAFNDTTLGRALDAIYERGAGRLFGQVAPAAAAAFPAELDLRHLRFLATSVSVWGEYAAREQDGEQGLSVTFGLSRDLRPDLKQFFIQMLRVHRSIPILGGCADGNASDKTVNNAVLTRLSACMARHGLAAGAFVYVADAAIVTPANLTVVGENLLITRLPFTYGEAERVVAEAVQEGPLDSRAAVVHSNARTARPRGRRGHADGEAARTARPRGRRGRRREAGRRGRADGEAARTARPRGRRGRGRRAAHLRARPAVLASEHVAAPIGGGNGPP